MPFDYKRAFRELYLPGSRPALVTVPPMRFAAVWGEGDPNAPDGEYARALAALYGISYALRMSARGGHAIDGFFEYVVPPLEGLWRQDGRAEFDPALKDRLRWISMIRLPDFAAPEDFRWAASEAARKKGTDTSRAEYLVYDEGLCAQCMHVGPYSEEPATLARLHAFIEAAGCEPDLSGERAHHEIYLGDPRRTAPEKLRTVLRLPVRRRTGE